MAYSTGTGRWVAVGEGIRIVEKKRKKFSGKFLKKGQKKMSILKKFSEEFFRKNEKMGLLHNAVKRHSHIT